MLLARALVSVCVLLHGFVALSDDDFSRAVIAQQFARSPSFDPSGTSWLPAPFWGTGTFMVLFGADWSVARSSAFLTGLVAAAGVWGAAAMLGLGRGAALVGAFASLALPYSALLGVAAVPDYPTAVLLLIGAASVAVREGEPLRPVRRLLGATALLFASWSRYEAWPVAVGFSAIVLLDIVRARGSRSSEPAGEGTGSSGWAMPAMLGASVLMPLAGPFSWLIHGVFRHGDAFFFVKRVAAYQIALGGAATPWLERLVASPWALFRWEPELMGVTLGLVAVALVERHSLRHWGRPLLLLGLVVGFLMVGDVRQTGATHHPERSLLALWLAACLFCAEVLVATVTRSLRRGVLVASLLALWIPVAFLVVRPQGDDWQAFAQRSSEVRIGELARMLVAPDERLVIDTPDYGFFAVIAAFGDPSRARPLQDRDPRRKAQGDPTQSPEGLRQACRGARWLVSHESHRPLALTLGRERGRAGQFSLIELAVASTR